MPVAGEPFIIRYDLSVNSRHAASGRDVNRDTVPDAIGGLADDVRTSSHRVSELLGWTHRGPAIEVVLGRTPFAEGAAIGGSRTMIVVPSELHAPARLAAVAHQVAHVAVQELAAGAPDAWEEAVATFVAETILAEQAGIDVGLEQFLPARHPDRSLLSPGLLASRGDALFLRYLDMNLAATPWLPAAMAALPRQLENARGRLDPRIAGFAAVAEALDEVLAHRGWSLAEAVAEYQAWMLEQDLLVRGLQTSVDAEVDMFPASESRTGDALAAFGQVRFGIQVPPTGGLEIAFDGDTRLAASAVALLDDGSVRRFPVTGGRAQPTTLSGARLARVIVLVQSPQIPASWSSTQPADASHDDPGFRLSAVVDRAYPFQLTSISTEVAAKQVTLNWDTSSEQDLLGWWVERAIRPAGPFLRVVQAPVPALSWPGERSSYSFVDATVLPATRYYYRVQGVTSPGLAEPSPTTAVRTLPAAGPAASAAAR
jgi:hypothetical protein